MTRAELIQLERETLIVRAEQLGVPSARSLTRPELVDEILRNSAEDPQSMRLARGFFGLARDLLARVVQRGLHLPDAQVRIQGSVPPPPPRQAGPAIPTITLADIYASQGHAARAVNTLRALLDLEPNNENARARLATLLAAEAASVASGGAEVHSAPNAQPVAGSEIAAAAPDGVEEDDAPIELDAAKLAAHLRASGAALAARAQSVTLHPAQVAAVASEAPGQPVPGQPAHIEVTEAQDPRLNQVQDALDNGPANRVLPQRAEATCAVVPLGAGRWHVAWDAHLAGDEGAITATTAAPVEHIETFALVIFTAVPKWSGAQGDATRDVPAWAGSAIVQDTRRLATSHGSMVLRDVAPNAVVRALLARQTASGLVAIAIAPQLQAVACAASQLQIIAYAARPSAAAANTSDSHSQYLEPQSIDADALARLQRTAVADELASR